MSKSSASSNPSQSSLEICPLDAPIIFKRGENGVREMHHSSLNLKWYSNVQWNIRLGDIIAVAVPSYNEDSNSDPHGGQANNDMPALSKREILEWDPIQDLQPKKKARKGAPSASPTSSIHWRLATVLAIGSTVSRTSDKKTETDYYLKVEWLYRATETKYSKELGKNFRPYRPNDMLSQLQYVVLSTSKYSKISLMHVLPATIGMLKQAEINKGVDLESLNMDNLNSRFSEYHKFKLWKLPFYCPKRINEKGSLVPEDENGDVWSTLSATLIHSNNITELYKNAPEIPVPNPLLRAWRDCGLQQDEELMTKLREAFQREHLKRQSHWMEQEEDAGGSNNGQDSSASSSDGGKENQRQTLGKNRDKRQKQEKLSTTVKNKRKNQGEVGQRKRTKKSDKMDSQATKEPGKKKQQQRVDEHKKGERPKVQKLREDAKKKKIKQAPTKKPSKPKATIKKRETKSGKNTTKRSTSLDPPMPKKQNLQGKAPNVAQMVGIRSSSNPIWKYKNQHFYQEVEIEISPGTQVGKSKTSSENSCWKLHVGCVVPVRYIDKRKAKPGAWYPFKAPWCPALVVSIYQDVAQDMKWMTEIRWFDQFKNLATVLKKSLDRDTTDQDHVVVETECYQHLELEFVCPGIVVFPSNHNSNQDYWDVVLNSDGIPFIPRVCSHMCADEDILEVNWISRLNDSIWRGMSANPANRKTGDKLIKHLGHVYKDTIESQSQTDNEFLPKKWLLKEAGTPSEELDVGEPFDPSKAIVEFGQVWWSSSNFSSELREFTDSVRLSVFADRKVTKYRGRKRNRNDSFDVRIGDIVCFADEKATRSRYHHNMKNLWHPFSVKWSFGQVLVAYRDFGCKQRTEGVDECGPIRLEVRRLLRSSDLPVGVKNWMPPKWTPAKNEPQMEEIYETNQIVSDLQASHVLGIADLCLGFQLTMSSHLQKVSCRCRYFYVAEVARFQPLDFGSTPSKWRARFLERGLLHASKILPESEELSAKAKKLVARIAPSDLLGSPESEREKFTEFKDDVLSEKISDTMRYYNSVSIAPSWSDYVLGDMLYHGQKRSRDSYWNLALGNIIAIRKADDDNSEVRPKRTVHSSRSHLLYPFKCPWSPCQVISIFSNSRNDDDRRRFTVEVLPLSMSNGLASDVSSIPVLVEDSDTPTKTIQSQDILGPLALFPRQGDVTSAWENIARHIPVVPVHFKGIDLAREPWSSLKNKFQRSKHYSVKEIDLVMSRIKGNEAAEAVDLQKCRTTNTENTSSCKFSNLADGASWISTKPMHVDKSSLRAFYSELKKNPPYKDYQTKCERPAQPQPWTVKLGDIVEVNNNERGERYPFKCLNEVAEVLCIFREFKTESELRKAQNSIKKLQQEADISDDIMVEVRWIYRRLDIAGVSSNESKTHFEEVFETDELDVVDASSLLAPAVLHSDPDACKRSEPYLGMPVQDYACLHFWSLNRKSLIPSNGLAGINERGRLYSKFLPREIQKSGNSATTYQLSKSNRNDIWRDAFTSVIKKLTLRDASSEAYDCGAGLIGREKEMERILSFLRIAIGGDAQTEGLPSSMFLAGPPGVGKTACVRAAVARLQLERADGEIPPFSLISLNGMEMRHPYEAYVRLWETLSGNCDIRTPEEACKRLETYFTSPWQSSRGARDRSVVVVLLDEIDYLVTEKQSVLYNFFDWPKRAAEVEHGKRLVVIGISNTLNLADQLMPSVQSRAGMEKCSFKAYNLNDTVNILKSKIHQASPDYAVFEDDAIVLAAKKTAALCGDIRKAFQIGRAAAEMVMKAVTSENIRQNDSAGKPIVRIGDVHKAGRESFNMVLVTAVSFSTPFQALLLVSLAALGRSTGRESGGFDVKDIIRKMHALAGASGDQQYSAPPTFGETIHLLTRVGETNLIKLRTPNSSFQSSLGAGGVWPLVSLAVDDSTILRGLKGTPHETLAHKNLAMIR